MAMTMGNKTPALNEDQYSEIESAVMESERGRAFLKEFLARNRQADTMMLLDAISRLESALCLKTVDHDQPGEFTPALADIASVITATRTDIVAIRNDLIAGGGMIPEGAEPFSAAAEEASTVSTGLLAEVEKLETLAWRIREQGMADSVCDQLDACVDELMNLCWKQDVNGQRAAKALNILQFVSECTGGNLTGTPSDDAPAPEFMALPSVEQSTEDEAPETESIEAGTAKDSFFAEDADLFNDDYVELARPEIKVAPEEPASTEDAESEAETETDVAPDEQAAEAEEPGDNNGHIVIIRTPSEPMSKSIPEPASRGDEPESGETPLVSIPAVGR